MDILRVEVHKGVPIRWTTTLDRPHAWQQEAIQPVQMKVRRCRSG